MEQARKNRKRTHYRNYINEKLVGIISIGVPIGVPFSLG